MHQDGRSSATAAVGHGGRVDCGAPSVLIGGSDGGMRAAHTTLAREWIASVKSVLDLLGCEVFRRQLARRWEMVMCKSAASSYRVFCILAHVTDEVDGDHAHTATAQSG